MKLKVGDEKLVDIGASSVLIKVLAVEEFEDPEKGRMKLYKLEVDSVREDEIW